MARDRIDELLAGIDFPGTRPLQAQVERAAEANRRADETAGWDDKPLYKYVKGVKTEFFTIGHLAAALGRKQVTIRSWEDKGWLPVTGYHTRPPKGEQIPGKKLGGKRLYTRAMVQTVIDAADECNALDPKNRDIDWKKFRQLVLRGWTTA